MIRRKWGCELGLSAVSFRLSIGYNEAKKLVEMGL